MSQFTHFDGQGNAHMVDISDKQVTKRIAIASAWVEMQQTTLTMIKNGSHAKGDVLGIARIAGIQGAKQTSNLIPLCHPLSLTKVAVEFSYLSDTQLLIEVTVKTDGKTGVEMEALTAASTTALTVFDMCKAVDKSMVISHLQVDYKQGGKSGTYHRTNGEA